MLTDQAMNQLGKVFATKEDLKNFATKEDLKKFATKADIKLLVTKKDHDHQYNYLVATMATKDDIREIRNQFDELKEGFSRVMNSVDGIARILAELRQEMAFSAVQYARQLEWNHKVAEKVGIPFDY